MGRCVRDRAGGGLRWPRGQEVALLSGRALGWWQSQHWRISSSAVQLHGTYREKSCFVEKSNTKGILFLELFWPLCGRVCVEASREGRAAEAPARPWRGESGQKWRQERVESFEVRSEKQWQTQSAKCSFPLWKFPGFLKPRVSESDSSGEKAMPQADTGSRAPQCLQWLACTMSACAQISAFSLFPF